MDLDLLDATLRELGEASYRADQIWSWVAGGARSYEAMTNLPSALRVHLAEHIPFSTLTLAARSNADDGTEKALLRTADGKSVEAVLMRFRDGRRSLCVSSQSGCPLTCAFCATGQMRFARNLRTSEILDQALHFRRVEPVDHLVFMGMGEPLLNIANVLGACRRLPDIGITHRRTTISTVGWIPGIEAMIADPMPIRLAFSLHAPEDDLRSRLMPVNDRFPLADVLAACHRWHEAKKMKVFVEYVMLADVNDQTVHALALRGLLDPKVFKVNLIPYNPTGSVYDGSGRETIAAFRSALAAHGLSVTVRLTRGRDINAACGQLAARAA